MKFTKEDLMRYVEEEDVEFIRLQFTDISGTLKNVAITKNQLENALNRQCMFDGSSIEGFARTEESDMYLYPDLSTFTVFPWRPQQGKVARIICDIYTPEGSPFEGDSRYVLKKVLKEARDMGYHVEVGPECEFFLLPTDDQGRALMETAENAGYFDLGPADQGENARRDMVLTLEAMGYEVEASHHEAAPGQHEIDLGHGPALRTADAIQTFKLTARTIARRHGLFATFMPKPKTEVNGSGLHINLSLTRDGKNVFFDSTDEKGLSTEAYYFIGGILKHMRGMSAVTNPLINSYKRLVPGFGAPIDLAWSFSNRSPLIRIPSSKGERRRIELRSPDPASNPYLTLAVCFAAGLDGIRNRIDPPSSISQNLFALTDQEKRALRIESLPGNLQEALLELERDELILGVLGEHIAGRILSSGRADWEDYRGSVSEWEMNRYLYRT